MTTSPTKNEFNNSQFIKMQSLENKGLSIEVNKSEN